MSKWELWAFWDSGWVDVCTAGRESLPQIPWSEILRAKRIVNFPDSIKRLKIHDMSFIVRRLTQGAGGRVLVLLLWLGGEMILAQRTGCRCTFLISFCFQVWVCFFLFCCCTIKLCSEFIYEKQVVAFQKQVQREECEFFVMKVTNWARTQTRAISSLHFPFMSLSCPPQT